MAAVTLLLAVIIVFAMMLIAMLGLEASAFTGDSSHGEPSDAVVSIRIPREKYDQEAFERNFAISYAPGAAKEYPPLRIVDKTHDYMVFVDLPTGAAVSLDNSNDEFTGTDLAHFSSDMRLARATQRVKEARVYKLTV